MSGGGSGLGLRLKKFYLMGMFALSIAATGTRAAMLIATRVPAMMRTVPSRTRVHVARKAGAKSADQSNTHLYHDGLGPVVHS